MENVAEAGKVDGSRLMQDLIELVIEMP